LKNRWITVAALAFAILLGAGCSSTGGEKDDDANADGSGSAAGDGSATTAGASSGGMWTGNPVDDPDSPLYTKTIYFDYDVSELRSEYLDTLQAHAGYLSSNPGITVVLEGHCDERGSREYNVGLGERRANVIQQYLEAEGVDPSQITTLSYGEERPDDTGHSEAAWAMNRRAILVY